MEPSETPSVRSFSSKNEIESALDLTKIESILDLTKLVEESEKIVQNQLGSLAGVKELELSYEGEGEVPLWALHHIIITKKLELAVKELQASSQALISDEVLPSMTQPEELTQLIKQRENEMIPVEVMQTLRQSQATVTAIASKVNALQLSQAILLPLSQVKYADPHHLLIKKQDKNLKRNMMQWHLNLALLMTIYERTNDPELRKKLSFLAIHYLAKAAPIKFGIDVEESYYENLFQLGFFQSRTYHRETSTYEVIALPLIKAVMPPFTNKTPLIILVDTNDTHVLFPIKFSVFQTDVATVGLLEEAWTDQIAKQMLNYLKAEEKITDLSETLDPPFLLDLTSLIEDVVTQGDKEKNELLAKQFSFYENLMDKAVTHAVQIIKSKLPDLFLDPLKEKQLEIFIRKNIICICRAEYKTVPFLKLLPLFYEERFFLSAKPDDEFSSIKNAMYTFGKVKIEEFVNLTGCRLGAVRAREKIFQLVDLQELVNRSDTGAFDSDVMMVKYGPLGSNAIYYDDKNQILKSHLFSHFHEKLPKQAKVLGISVMQLIEGLLTEISEEKWRELNADPNTRQLFQTSLFQMMRHLAEAQQNKNHFDHFAQAIELIHSEIATLLFLTTPFKEGDFYQIFLQQLKFIPKSLRGNVKIGLAKSGMNVFAGVNAAVKETTPQMVRVYGEGTYFQEAELIGENNTIESVLSNPNIEQVDLYVGEFNHNINIDPNHSSYHACDIINDIEQLLITKPQITQLTVAIDCTIDFVHSNRNKALLKHFSKQIKNGRLNFVFFRSGQKFDMLGTDNYYAALLFIVNNGEKKWAPFDTLTTQEVYKTDPLSFQWFCLLNKYAPMAVDYYLGQIFDNTRQVLKHIPKLLKPGGNPIVKVCTVAENMEPCFIDIKCYGNLTAEEIEAYVYLLFKKYEMKIHHRGSFGFYHCNTNIIKNNLRINLGLNPAEVGVLIDFFNKLALKIESESLQTNVNE